MAVIIGNCLATLNHCMPHPALHFCGIAFTAPRAPGKGTLIFSTGFLDRQCWIGPWPQRDGTGQDRMGQQSLALVLFSAGMLEGNATKSKNRTK